MEAASTIRLEREIRYFDEHRLELLAQAAGEYALIKGTVLVGTFVSETEAIGAGFERFGNDSFLVKRIVEANIPLPFATSHVISEAMARSQWRHFAFYVGMGIVACLIWLGTDAWLVPLFLLMLSAGLSTHTTCIRASGEHGPECAPEVAAKRDANRRPWLHGILVDVAIGLVVMLAGPTVWEALTVTFPVLVTVAAHVGDILLLLAGGYWLLRMATTVRTLKARDLARG